MGKLQWAGHTGARVLSPGDSSVDSWGKMTASLGPVTVPELEAERYVQFERVGATGLCRLTQGASAMVIQLPTPTENT